jgi:hypothetical protein
MGFVKRLPAGYTYLSGSALHNTLAAKIGRMQHCPLSRCVAIHIPDPTCSIVGSHTCLLERPWKTGSLAGILVKIYLRYGTCRFQQAVPRRMLGQQPCHSVCPR